ncbi:MAG: HPr family phosphocarrier protein [Clostridia bacterium]|nr:HPr family phosphocarrier protein [Clostridia bacterium]
MKIIRLECIAENGLHARPAALISKCAKGFASKCFLVNEDNRKKADARSVTAIMTLGVKKGGYVSVECEGADEEDAARTLAGLIAKIEE